MTRCAIRALTRRSKQSRLATLLLKGRAGSRFGHDLTWYERRAGRRRWMTRICVTWDVLLVLLNPPHDFTSCRAGARPGHPITRREQSQQIASLFDHLISAGEERSRYSDTEDHAPPDRSRARRV